MTTLTITRGLPGSGKTTWAKQQFGMRVNRDDLREMLLRVWPHGDTYHENLLTGIQRRAVGMLLECGIDVIIDDTNLRPDVVEYWRVMAADYGVAFQVEDFTHVPLETCLARDAVRPEPVGETVIRRMWQQYLACPCSRTVHPVPGATEIHPDADCPEHGERRAADITRTYPQT